MPQLPPSSDFAATRRVLVSTQRGAHAPRVPFDAPRVEHLSPGIRDEASRTTREGACVPPPPRRVAEFLFHAVLTRMVGRVTPKTKTGRFLILAHLGISSNGERSRPRLRFDAPPASNKFFTHNRDGASRIA